MRKGAQNDSALQGEVPVLEVFDIARHPVLDIRAVTRLAPEAAHLGEAGNAGLHESAHVVVRHELRELVVVLDQMRARPDDAHVAEEHVPELRDLVDAQFAKPFPQRINPLVAIARLPRLLGIIGTHRAELVDREPPVLHAGPGLDMKERAGD